MFNKLLFTLGKKLKEAKSSKLMSLHSTIRPMSFKVTKLNLGLLTLKKSMIKFKNLRLFKIETKFMSFFVKTPSNFTP